MIPANIHLALSNLKHKTTFSHNLLNCMQHFPSRQGDAGRNAEYEGDEEDWNPEVDAKASTLSRDNSGRGSIR